MTTDEDAKESSADLMFSVQDAKFKVRSERMDRRTCDLPCHSAYFC